MFTFKYIEKQGLKTKERASSGLFKKYDVEGILKIDYGGFCRSVKKPVASTSDVSLLSNI